MRKQVIYIYTFAQKVLPVKNGVALEVGAGIRSKFMYSTMDNTGDNISALNETFGELTGLYWVWKNCLEDMNDEDIIGFCHYNKAFSIKPGKIEKYFSDQKDLKWIAIPSIQNRDHPILSELRVTENVLKEKYPEYYKSWCQIYDETGAGTDCRGGNMFITTKKNLNLYCEFLFGTLLEVYKKLGPSDNPDKSLRRYCAFMGERLLSVYFRCNEITPLDVEVRYSQWYLSYVRKIIKLLNLNRQNKLYMFLRNEFGYKSSYGRRD